MAARYRQLRQDDFGAESALRQAAMAPDYHDYFSRQFALPGQHLPEGESADARLYPYDLFAFWSQLDVMRNLNNSGEVCSTDADGLARTGDYCLA